MKVIHPSDNENRTQEQWISYFNEKKQRMISLPDIFQLLKDTNTEEIESLREDFDDRWIVTSTRIIYDPNDLSAKVIHNAGSTVTRPKEIQVNRVPVCQPTYASELLDDADGLNYVRALLDNQKATKEQIIDFLVKLSGKEAKKIRFWTPTQSYRKERQVRAVVLCFGDLGRFGVNGDDWVGGSNIGLSRGVIVKSAKQTRFKSNKAVFDTEEKIILIPMTRKIRMELLKKASSKMKIKWNLKVRIR